MHLIMILVTLGLAFSLRLLPFDFTGNWTQRWQKTLLLFLFPPLLLLVTAFAILYMGADGKMFWLKAGWFSYLLAIGFLGYTCFCLLRLTYQGWQSWRQVRTYSQQEIAGNTARILQAALPYSTQIGFWKPELVVSEGLLDSLDLDHLQAVLAHEQAHYHHRDTFWFFWLGWLHSCTYWLANSESLWQELLLLREMRADRDAAVQVDPLLLAEALLTVASAPLKFTQSYCASLSCATPRNRLAERIDALLSQPETPVTSSFWSWTWLLFVFLPLITVPFHQ